MTLERDAHLCALTWPCGGPCGGERLSLNVAGDLAQTLSVLGNMGGVLDDCGLRFVQMRRRLPQNTPDFGGPKINFEKSRACNHTKSMN